MRQRIILAGGATLALLLFLIAWLQSPKASEPIVVSSEPESSSEPVTDVRSPSLPLPLVEENEDARTEVAIADANAIVSSLESGGDTYVLIKVVAKETGKALVGARIFMQVVADGWTTVPDIRSEWSGVAGDYLTANETGVVRFLLEPGVEYSVNARAADELSKPESVRVPALKLSEQREVTIELESDPDVHFFGRLVTEESEVPEDGKVVLSNNESVVVGADGRFEVSARSWKNTYGTASALGCSKVFFELTSEHAFPELARDIELKRSAALQVRVLDAGGEAIRVTCTVKSYLLVDQSNPFDYFFPPDAKWKASTDAYGDCKFSDLPSGAPITISFTGEERSKKLPDFVHLQPGETRSIEVGFSLGATIQGVARYASGEAAAGEQIWLVSSAVSWGAYFETDHQPSGITITNKRGEFSFKAVDPGNWDIGPAPVRGHFDEATEGLIAPVATTIEVHPEDVLRELSLTLHRGLYIRGAVLDPNGQSLDESVYVQSSSIESGYVNVRTDDEGRFALGPLIPGTYTLSTNAAFMTGFQECEAQVVEAGTSGVELRLRFGAALRGKVIDEVSQAAIEAGLILSWLGTEENQYPFLMTSTHNGDFEFKGLAAGTYSVFASRSDGGAGFLRIDLADQVDSEEQVVALVAGGTIEIAYEGEEDYGQFQLWFDDIVVGADGILSGTKQEFVVPAGRIRVVRSFGLKKIEQFVDVRAGDVKLAQFGSE